AFATISSVGSAIDPPSMLCLWLPRPSSFQYRRIVANHSSRPLHAARHPGFCFRGTPTVDDIKFADRAARTSGAHQALLGISETTAFDAHVQQVLPPTYAHRSQIMDLHAALASDPPGQRERARAGVPRPHARRLRSM